MSLLGRALAIELTRQLLYERATPRPVTSRVGDQTPIASQVQPMAPPNLVDDDSDIMGTVTPQPKPSTTLAPLNSREMAVDTPISTNAAATSIDPLGDENESTLPSKSSLPEHRPLPKPPTMPERPKTEDGGNAAPKEANSDMSMS